MCRIDHSDDFATILHERQYRARKPHVCMECRRSILPGSSYMVERLISDGNASTHKTCLDCWEYRDWLLMECGGFIYGQVLEDFGDHLGEYGFFN